MQHHEPPPTPTPPSRRGLLGVAAGATIATLLPRTASAHPARARAAGPVMIGSANALAGMQRAWPLLVDGGAPLDAAIETVKVVEADPDDTSVGLGGIPNEDGVVQLDAACMHGPTHNSGAVAALENILHPSEVARLVMERTDHCLIVGRGAYEFARAYGHPHTELLTDRARRIWLRWRESMSSEDDRLAPADEPGDEPADGPDGEKHGSVPRAGREVASGLSVPRRFERHGTVHCSVLSAGGELACTTTTSGLGFKIPGRVGDSPIVGAGLYCDQEAGSAGSTGRGEAAILANGSFAIVELMRGGMAPLDAGLEVLRRIVRQVERQARWQPALQRADKRPSFNISFYALDTSGRTAGVALFPGGKYAVADAAGGPRHEALVALFA